MSFANRVAVLAIFALALFAVSSSAATYTTVAAGNWNSNATWGGPPPPKNVTSDQILIKHSVNFEGGTDLLIENDGSVRIQGPNIYFRVASGVNVLIKPGGEFYIVDADFLQCRFQPPAGNTYTECPASGIQQNGNVKNSGGYTEVTGSYVEVAQDWTNESSGVRVMRDSCVFTGQNFSVSGADETVEDSFISVGWHGSGSVQLSKNTIRLTGVAFEIAATLGGSNFQVSSDTRLGGVAAGTQDAEINYITLKKPGTAAPGSGVIQFDASVLNESGSNVGNIVKLGAYCVQDSLKYQPNGKVEGTPANDCNQSFVCGLTTPTAAPARISGRVLDEFNRPISRAAIQVVGGALESPIVVFTNTFGRYSIDLETGFDYVLSVSSKRHTFENPSRVISHVDQIDDMDFRAINPRFQAQPRIVAPQPKFEAAPGPKPGAGIRKAETRLFR